MQYETVKYEKEDGYAVITLNRPHVLNALNDVLMRELCDALADTERDDKISVFILTGAPRPDGRPCFSAGGDLKAAGTVSAGAMSGNVPEMPSGLKQFWQRRVMRSCTTFDSDNGAQEAQRLLEVYRRITWGTKLSIAAVDGVCTAGGLELALSCDIILASETAQMSDLHVKNLGRHGLAVGAPLAYRVGVSRAIELMCTGDVIDGNEAYRIGLANHVYAPDELIPEAKALANRLGARRPASLTVAKALARSIWDMDRHSTFIFNQEATSALSLEPDAGKWGHKMGSGGEKKG
jgi:enoyl-CoA hydratase/carnithine racemase